MTLFVSLIFCQIFLCYRQTINFNYLYLLATKPLEGSKAPCLKGPGGEAVNPIILILFLKTFS